MRVKEEYRGAKQIICSVVLDNGRSPAEEFLLQLKQRSPESHKSMVNRYRRHADNGPASNIRHERHISDRGNLWEFKTWQGDRLLYFNHPDGRVVLTNGFHKGDPAPQRYDVAERLRDQILRGETDHGAAKNGAPS